MSKQDSRMSITRNETIMGLSNSEALDITNEPLVSITKLTEKATTVDAATFAFDSVNIPANKLILVVISTYLAGTLEPTLSGAGLTWVSARTSTLILGGQRVTVFRAVSSTATSGVITCDWAGVSQNAIIGGIFVVENAYLSEGSNGSLAIGTGVSSTVVSGTTSQTSSMPAMESPYNAILTAAVFRVNENITPNAGYTELIDLGVGTPNFRLQVSFRNMSHPTFGWSWTTTEFIGFLAMEIRSK